ncbi:GntR family transcriptional regulator [Cryobacterium sp. TMS1-20-1]|uniref:GntR family transcriptional regulator n=1 Tax=Cryobacterium sp. TMS1-20-1 TaxID=1259223 RepID=UPI00106AC05F|nr:GntR family transcriptional regulator [Cryobacterium sp. TMS1-20-1]TFC73566.1 GntR family transcriptional regulator [Cryobacterium sp. TMS1-20-1]
MADRASGLSVVLGQAAAAASPVALAGARRAPAYDGVMWLDEVPASAVDSANGTPLHSQVGAVIRSHIVDGALPPGSQLPTEAELQERFSVSRSVVRQALAALSAEGLVQRGRGRGSVVSPRGEHHRLVQRMSGLSTQISAEGADVFTAVLALGPEQNAAASAALGGSTVVGIRRLRSAGTGPLAVIHTWLPLSIGADLTISELTDASLHAVLRSRLGVSIVSGRRQVRAVAATTGLARLLEISVGEPLLLLEGTSLDENGLPIEMFSTWHRADRVVFDLDVVGTELQNPDLERDASPDSAPMSEVTGNQRTHAQLVARAAQLARELGELAAELALND